MTGSGVQISTSQQLSDMARTARKKSIYALQNRRKLDKGRDDSNRPTLRRSPGSGNSPVGDDDKQQPDQDERPTLKRRDASHTPGSRLCRVSSGQLLAGIKQELVAGLPIGGVSFCAQPGSRHMSAHQPFQFTYLIW